jgi:hypothetical protein
MKKLFYLILFSAVLVGCSKNEETLAEKIIGTWELQYFYRDTLNNPINIDLATNYKKIESTSVRLTFNPDTACGLKTEYRSTYYVISSYTVNDSHIYATKSCTSTERVGIPSHYINNMGEYKIIKDSLIVASNNFYIEGRRIKNSISYGYYVREK